MALVSPSVPTGVAAKSCRYCYVREYPNALHAPSDWGGWVAPKLNAPELLWSQRHKLHNARVFMASATDPYQPLERQYRLSRRCLEVLLLCPSTEVIVHTRSPGQRHLELPMAVSYFSPSDR